MFIDRLTKDDVQELITDLNLDKNFWISDVNYLDFYEFQRWEIKLVRKTSGFRSTISFKDFEIHGNCSSYDKQAFKDFMCKKFGDEYKQAFNERLRKKYEEEMIK